MYFNTKARSNVRNMSEIKTKHGSEYVVHARGFELKLKYRKYDKRHRVTRECKREKATMFSFVCTHSKLRSDSLYRSSIVPCVRVQPAFG